MEAVEFKNVTKTFKSRALGKKIIALKNISFQIEEGESVAVMGPSPSGKTTLLKLTAGIYRPDEGDIKIFGKSIKRDLNWARKNTYYVSQYMQLNKKLTILEEIKYFQEIFGNKISEEGVKMLEAVGIREEDYGKRIEVLSETQITILKLILGLIKKPKILLMDNILGDLEHEIFEEILGILKSSGLTMMIVDKSVDVLNSLCEKIIILRNGEIMDMGYLREILSDYPYKYDVEVMWRGQVNTSEISDISKYPYKIIGDTIRFNLKDEIEVKELIEKLMMKMKNIVKIQISGLDIEDVYYWRLDKQKT